MFGWRWAAMKFGVSYHTAVHGMDPDRMVAYAQRAEELGFESFFLPEHIALYPGATIGGMAVDPSAPIADPLDSLSFVAAATGRILLGTAVALVPYHHPVILAKRLATIDVLSRGRMRLFTVGLGILASEAAAVGVDFATRGRRADEAIDVMRMLWAGDEDGVSIDGKFYSFPPITSYPKPYNSRSLPIHVGGSSEVAARRAGLRGDGYFPGGRLTKDERSRQIDLMRKTAADAGRDADALEYTRLGSIDMTADDVAAQEQLGVTRLVVSAIGDEPEEELGYLSLFAERVGLT